MKSILLTNDDGVNADGLKSILFELRHIANVLVVAPDQNRSAVSHGLSVHTHFKLEETGSDCFSLNGTPAECVIYALDKLFVEPPDLVISGINHGANLGDHIMYSGTVAAAREAARYGMPAIAISQDFENGKKIRFKEGTEFVLEIVKAMLDNGLNGELLLNINIPVGKVRGMKITRQGYSKHQKHFTAPSDERHPFDSQRDMLISDRLAILEGYVSITPLERDQTDYVSARLLAEAAKQLYKMP